MRPASVLALVGSAVLGLALGVGGGLWLDRGSSTFTDPLSLDFPMQNQACTGQYLVVVGKGGPSALGASLASNPTGHYLDTTSSCDTAWTDAGRAAPPWIAYLGPFTSGTQACELRMSPEHKGTTVVRLQQGLTDTRHCICYLDYRTMPTLEAGQSASVLDSIWTRALQNLLVDMGRAKPDEATGVYDLSTAAQIRDFQRDSTLNATGVVDDTTWHALQNQGCPLYDQPSEKASP